MNTPLENLMASYQKTLAPKQGNALMFGQLAQFHYNRGKFSDAISVCQQALQLQPDLATSMIIEKVLSAIGKTDADGLLSQPGIDNWIELDAEAIATYPDGINQIYKCELDGIVIRQVFSQQEMADAIQQLEKRKDAMIPTSFGEIFGYPVNNLDGELEDFRKSAWWRNELNTILGGCFEARLEAILTKISGQRTVEILGEDPDKKCVPASLRIYKPNKGGLRPHTDREFIEMNNSYGDRLRQIAKSIKCMLGYFLLLDKSETGGELIVYDRPWEQTPPALKAQSTTEERQAFLEPFRKITIKIDVGDLVIFNSRRIWHCICDIKGKKSRVTAGGTISISKDDRQLFYWS